MQRTLGISAGADVVCSAVLTTSDDGVDSFDYRTLTADDSHTDVGYLVASSIDIALARTDTDIGQIAVTYRTDRQARSVRDAATHFEITLVPELPAILAYLRHTGEVAGYGAVVVVDVGASGTTVTVVDQVDGTVRATDRIDSIGGNAFDDVLLELATTRALSIGGDGLGGDRILGGDRTVATARLRTAKEHLSTAHSVSIRTGTTEEITVDRGEFDAALGDLLLELRRFVSAVIERSGVTVDALALVGGGAHVPAVVSAMRSETALPIIRTTEPDAVLAKGAALVIRSSPSGQYPVRFAPVAQPTISMGRTAGILAAALAVTAFVLVYGLQVVVPSDVPAVSPAATATMAPSTTDRALPSRDSRVEPGSAADRYGTTSRANSSGAVYPVAEDGSAAPITPTPSLRPAPGLPSFSMPPVTRSAPSANRAPFVAPQTPTFSNPITDVTDPSLPLTSEPVTTAPVTSVPPTSVPPTSAPPTSVPPTSVPPTEVSTPGSTGPAITTDANPGSSAPNGTAIAPPPATQTTVERNSPPIATAVPAN